MPVDDGRELLGPPVYHYMIVEYNKDNQWDSI